MKKKYIIMLILLLTVGFASLTTSLIVNSKVDLGLLESDLDVIFKEVLLNKETSDKAFIVEDGKSFIYSADDLVELNQTSEIDYTIMNKSHQYDMEVKVTCVSDYEDYLSYSSETIDKSILIEAGEVVTGDLLTELIKEKEFDDSLVLKCTLYYVPVSRDTIVEDEEYIVSFDTGYEEKVSDIKVKYYEVYGSLPELTRSNYAFLGWYTEDDVKVESNSLVKIKSDHTLYAKWEYVCQYTAGQVWTFDYTGAEQTFTVPCNGEYKLETWGAQGGSTGVCTGGYGGYSVGNIQLEKGIIYINVGGSGIGGLTWVPKNGGYNGGGNAAVNSDPNSYNASGGGATHISIVSGVLSSLEKKVDEIFVVSGAGGGTGYNKVYGCGAKSGSGGGFTGGDSGIHFSPSVQKNQQGYGGTQISGGKRMWYSVIIEPSSSPEFGSFGKGGSGENAWSGGGSGFYGGTNAGYVSGGGSGYIGNPLLTDKAMYCYNCTTSNEESTKTISTTCTSSIPTPNCAKQGNGYAKITYLG